MSFQPSRNRVGVYLPVGVPFGGLCLWLRASRGYQQTSALAPKPYASYLVVIDFLLRERGAEFLYCAGFASNYQRPLARRCQGVEPERLAHDNGLVRDVDALEIHDHGESAGGRELECAPEHSPLRGVVHRTHTFV